MILQERVARMTRHILDRLSRGAQKCRSIAPFRHGVGADFGGEEGVAPLKSTQTDRPPVVRRSRPLAGGLIRVGVATEIPVVLREFGAEPHPILARVGLSE